MAIFPKSRPQITRGECLALAKAKGYEPPFIMGDRGYYLDSMGSPGTNDRGIYDDAIMVVGPAGMYAAFNANTDPSITRKGVAVLKPGVYLYKKGIHGLSRPKYLRYEALVQASEVEVSRDMVGDDRGWFGINIHRGSLTSTSSLGCQTVQPFQWPAFKSLVYDILDRTGSTKIPYILITETDRRLVTRKS